jgi:CDP-diacylglycerol---glycerol-3-phosphate 3-phosphatidyltransferase
VTNHFDDKAKNPCIETTFCLAMAVIHRPVTLIWLVVLNTLLASSVTSSFVPRGSLLNILSRQSQYEARGTHFRGGSSEEFSEVAPTTLDEESEQVQEVSVALSSPESSSVKQTAMLGPNAPPPGPLRRSIPNFPWHLLPNLLTYVRCLAIPALVAIFYLPDRHVATGVLFAVASLTDWFDGYLARRWDITSAFGAFLDPVADKLMVSTSLILLSGRYGLTVAIPTSIILAREISVSALREWMAQRGQRDLVKVGIQGKIKTALTMVALTVLLLAPVGGSGWLTKLYMPGIVMLYLCTLVTVTSGSVYFIAAGPLLIGK